MNNVCLVDNILNLADPVQHYFSGERTTDALQVSFLVISLFSFIMLWGTWAYEGNNLRLPAATFLFYLMKMLSDISLTLQPPNGLIWSKTISNIGLFKVTNLFMANVDPWVGNALLTFIFAFLLENKILKIVQIILSILTMIFVLIVLVFYQLSYSFAINSAVLIAVFSFVYSYDLNGFYEQWNKASKFENKNKIVPIKISDSENVIKEDFKGVNESEQNILQLNPLPELTPLPRNLP